MLEQWDKPVVVDFETYYDNEYSLKKITTEEYIRSNKFECIGVSVKIGQQPAEFYPREEGIPIVRALAEELGSVFVSHNCLTGDHEVRTEVGWVRLDALVGGEKILQWDPSTSEAEFVAYRPFSKPYSGTVYRSDTSYHKGVYTEDHRMYYHTPSNKNWRVASAKEIAARQPNSIYLPVSFVVAGSGVPMLTEDEVRLLEAIRADGWRASRRSAVFHVSRSRKIDRLKQLAVSLGLKITVSEDRWHDLSGVYNVRVVGDQVEKICNLLGKDKLLGDWVLSLPISVRRAWVSEIEHWDGTRSSRHRVEVSTANRNNAHWLSELAMFSGYQSFVDYDIPNNRGYSTSEGVLHKVVIRSRTRCKLIERPSAEYYNGVVYCVSVPSGAFVVRRGGKTWITGNCNFDMGILALRYNIHPDMTVDTVTLARLTGVDRLAGGSSLAKLADWLPTVGVDIPPKGTAVHNMIGVHADDMTAEQWREYADYCKHDSEISSRLYYLLMPRMLGTEIEMANITTQMWTHPVIDLDRPLLEQYYANLEVERDRLMDDMARRLALPSVEELGKVLRSRSKFPKLLETLGVEVPKKWSEKQQKNTPALAKTDPGFLELLEHEDPFIADLCQLRLDAASTLAMTRTKRFIEVSKRGLLPVPLIYASAHTGRYGGGGKLNIQNLPKRTNDLTIRRSMRAPKGCLWVAADSSQIEARLVAYAAGQQDLVDVFTSGRDVYVDMATKIYGESYDDIMAQAKGRDATPEGKKKRNIAKEVVLACGYGMSPATFARRMELQGMHEVAEQAEFLVGTYRNAYPMIKAFWSTCNTALETMLVDGELQFGSNDLFRAVGRYDVFGTNIPCVVLPDGTRIFYENLRKIGKGRRTETAYDQMKGRAKMETRIYGAKLTENLIQGLAFSVLKDQARRMANRGLHLVLNIHDEWATIVPERLAGAAAAIMYEEMTSVPLYLPQNLLACEVDVGRNYADMSFVNVGKILARAGV